MSERKRKSVELPTSEPSVALCPPEPFVVFCPPEPSPSIEFCPCQRIPDNLNPKDLYDNDLKAFWVDVRRTLSDDVLPAEFEQKLCPPTCCRPRHLTCRFPHWHPMSAECVWTPQRRVLWRPCAACRMYRDLLGGSMEVEMDSIARRLYALDPSCGMLNRLFEQYWI